MESFSISMDEFRRQLEGGTIQAAYQGLMEYIRKLCAYFKNNYPEYSVSGSIYYGYMDMTYFSLFPDALKRRKLKIAVVFVYDEFRFEVWLSGSNRDVQAKYWDLSKENEWNEYHLASNPRGFDYIVDHVLVADPDFGDLESLTQQIDRGVLEFVRNVESFLSRYEN